MKENYLISKQSKADYLLCIIRNKEKLNTSQQLKLVLLLSIPAVMAQISSIIMQYIDASMVGNLGSNESAAIGLVSSSTWLLGGITSAISAGFTIQVAHRIGASEVRRARGIVKQAIVITFLFSLLLAVIGAAISGILPKLLGADESIRHNASMYFFVYSLSIPAMQLSRVAGGMLQCSGNMKIPSLLNIIMCIMDVVFNFILIFPTREISVFGNQYNIYGADLGVIGAALGTTIAEFITAAFMLFYLLFRSKILRLVKKEKLQFDKLCIIKSAKLAIPIAFENVLMCGAMIVTTRIVSPLGNVAIAAHSFAITAESLCYMPGYGISDAAATLVGQSIGAGRRKMSERFAKMTVLSGMLIMTISGVAMYILAPYMMELLSPDGEIQHLGTEILRIEAFAEPMYGASIVASGALRGAGDTLIPSIMNFVSIWFVRLTLAYILSRELGLKGIWIAMCIELIFRGIIFLIRLGSGRWKEKV